MKTFFGMKMLVFCLAALAGCSPVSREHGTQCQSAADCTALPLSYCQDAATLLVYSGDATCVDGTCQYAAQPVACPSGCNSQTRTCTGCSNGCEPEGQITCTNGNYQRCQLGLLGCLAWGPSTACPLGSCANAHQCAGCANECETIGQGACLEGKLRTCVSDVQGCLSLGSESDCPSHRCQNQTTCADCTDGCAVAGEAQCLNGQIKTCALGASGCLEYGALLPCPSGQCLNSGACSECVKQCGDRVCGPDPVCAESCGECLAANTLCDEQNGQCVAFCDLDPILADRTLNIDLKVVTLSGVVTKDGQLMPSDAQTTYRGNLNFRRMDTGFVIKVYLGNSGPANYEVELYAGTYAVEMDSFNYGTTALPGQIVNLGTVELTDDMVRNFDLKVVTLSGVVTKGGQQLPNDAQATCRGNLNFRRLDSGFVIKEYLPNTGSASYEVEFYAGSYAVEMDSYNYDTTALPGQIASLGTVDLTADMQRNFDLTVVTLSGAVTKGGQQLPNDAQATYRGNLNFRRVDSGFVTKAYLGNSGSASYEVELYAGAYAVEMDSYNYDTTSLPGQIVNLGTVELAADTQRNFDLRVVNLSGVVTKGGQQLPNDAQTTYRGNLNFRRVDTGFVTKAYLGNSGPASFEAEVYAGSYAVEMDSFNYNTTSLPGQITSLGTVELAVDTQRNFDLQVVTLSGVVTKGGQQLPNDPQATYRGNLNFRRMDTGFVTKAYLGNSGSASYEVEVYTGIYAVEMDSYNYDTTALPGQIASLGTMELTADTVRNFDLQVVTLSGVVTKGGLQLPNDTQVSYRGGLDFRRLDTGFATKEYLGNSGPASYQVELYAGSYTVNMDSYNYNTAALPSQIITVLRGCPQVDPNCTASNTDLSGRWLFDFQDWMYSIASVDLTQENSTLSGLFTFVGWESGMVTGQVESGRRMTLTLHSSNQVDLQGTVVSPCMMIGNATVEAGWDSDFIARRMH